MIFGPTDTFNTLLNCSTYQSSLGLDFGNNKKIKPLILLKLKWTQCVNYIFIDEISMLACQDMYKISAKILNVFDLPFEDMNIIFAKGFAQLPLVSGLSLFSESIKI